MALPVEELRRGYDVDENAIRFSNYFHVLRELVHLSCGWLPLVGDFELKYRLGDHLHDDARSISKLRRRLYELRHPSEYPGTPGAELTALLDRMDDAGSADEYVAIAYGEAKPVLIDSIRVHLDRLDPVSDEPSLRLLDQVLARQERHTAEIPSEPASSLADLPLDFGALPIELKGEPRPLPVMAPLEVPARDSFVEVTEEGDPFLARELYVNDPELNHVPVEPEEQRHFFHGLMDAELTAAELMARNSHEHPEMPWDFHVDMARQTWDEMRHAKVHYMLMPTELGCRWGDYPVTFSYFKSIYSHDLLGRLALFNSTPTSTTGCDGARTCSAETRPRTGARCASCESRSTRPARPWIRRSRSRAPGSAARPLPADKPSTRGSRSESRQRRGSPAARR
jgi:hypothetical protein